MKYGSVATLIENAGVATNGNYRVKNYKTIASTRNCKG